MNSGHKKTIEVYEELGVKYIDSINRVLPEELPEFIGLLKSGSKVLDVGCAGGRDSRHFVEAGHKVFGIDVVDSFLREARKRVPGATFKKMDLLQLDFPDNTFDAIWAQAVLLHFSKSDLPKILKKFHRILKPGGLLHVRLKRGQGTHLVAEKLVEGKERLFTFYYKNEVEAALIDAKFKVIASRIYPDALNRDNVKWISVWGRK
jgi:ubiquinone/menaquinone biosynthesis C-methylase UbiE